MINGLTLTMLLGVKYPPRDGVITGIELSRSLKSSSKSKFDFGFGGSGLDICDFSCLGLSSSLSSSLDSSLELELDDLVPDFLKQN